MKSIWNQEIKLPEFTSLSSDKKVDVLVIGGGMAGLLTGRFLQQQNAKYILLEKNRIASGVTGNTTGKLTVHHGPIYSKLLRILGKDNAKLYLQANRIALDKYRELAEDIACDFSPQDNYVYSLQNKEGLLEELNALETIGGRAEYTERIDLPFAAAGAVRMRNQAQFHPLKFVAEIARGQEICEGSFVTDIVKERFGYSAAVKNRWGRTVRINADKVIVTTHFPFIDRWGLYFMKMYQNRSYVLALKDTGFKEGMYIGDEQNSFSFRSCGDLLLLGGCGGRTGSRQDGLSALREHTQSFYPRCGEVAAWAAQDCMTLDGVPYVGPYARKKDGLYTATGFNKWGMTGSMAAAMLLTGGMDAEIEKLFRPERSMLRPQLLVNGFEAVKNLLAPRRHRCTHLKCGLKWNDEEKSWDCPCHGSRFDQEGEVLDGPAQKKL